MMRVHEVSRLTGVSVRTLHYYDKIGLLKPAVTTDAGYRLYDDTALERLQHILLFRELQFPLKDIKKILDSSDFDSEKALVQQIELLQLRKEHLENLIEFAREVKKNGVTKMSFSAFDTRKMDEYTEQAKAKWGQTDAWAEFEEKSKIRSSKEEKNLGADLMDLFRECGTMLDLTPEAPVVQEQVKKIQDYVTEHYYTCTKEILAGLGQMYAAGGNMTENIDKAGGKGTANFVAEAIKIYCS